MTESVARAEDVPKELGRIARVAFMNATGPTSDDDMLAAIVAALNAWPRAEKSRDESMPCLILPLERKE